MNNSSLATVFKFTKTTPGGKRKSKINPEDDKSIIINSIKENTEVFRAILEENNHKIVTAMDAKLEPLVRDVASLSDKYEMIHIL